MAAETTQWFQLILNMHGQNRGFTEKYYMEEMTWDDNLPKALYIARWRAAILGRGWTLTRAVLSRVGNERVSDKVITRPILGSTGVKFPSADFPDEHQLRPNNPGTGLLYRFQTVTRHHVSRSFRALPDAFIEDFKFVSSDEEPDDFAPVPETSAGATVATALPNEEYYNYAEPVTPEPAGFVTWTVAMRNFLGGVRDFTRFFRIVTDPSPSEATSSSPSTTALGIADLAGVGRIEYHSWDKVTYERTTEVSCGDPSSV